VSVQTIAVLGARSLGKGIACAAALGGYRTILEDMSAATLDRGLAWIRDSLEKAVARGEMTPRARDAALGRVSTMRTVEDACREAHLVIEALPEEMELKIEIFTLLGKFARPGAIFASTAESLSVTEMASVTVCEDRCVGMRFSAPLAEAKRLEIVRGRETSEETVAACREVGQRMGMNVVVVRESPAGRQTPSR